VAVIGHDGLLTYAYPEILDNAKFITNLLKWLKGGGGSKVLYTTGHREWFNGRNSKEVGDALRESGLELQALPGTVTKSALDGASVLIIGNAWGDFSSDEISAVRAYVSDGNGLFLAGLGWSWARHNGRQTTPYPMAQIAKPYGIGWGDSVIADPMRYSNPPKGLETQFKNSPIFHTFFPNAK
jgi:hypothetical protein